MDRYIIEANHTVEDCLRVLDGFTEAGAHYLRRADWGCHGGVHTAWITVEAASDEDARLMAPPVIRAIASVTKLNKFTPEEIRELHERET
jgi:hypothetical protein